VKTFAVISIVLSSVLVAAWPVVFFFSAFLFDAPLQGAAAAARWVGVLWLWSYPLGYCVAIAYLFARRRDRPWWKPPTAYLFLLPFAHVALLALVIWVKNLFSCFGSRGPGCS
jgi:hypothetical protein